MTPEQSSLQEAVRRFDGLGVRGDAGPREQRGLHAVVRGEADGAARKIAPAGAVAAADRAIALGQGTGPAPDFQANGSAMTVSSFLTLMSSLIQQFLILQFS